MDPEENKCSIGNLFSLFTNDENCNKAFAVFVTCVSAILIRQCQGGLKQEGQPP